MILPPPQGGPSREQVVLCLFYVAVGMLIYLSVALFDVYAPRLPHDSGWCTDFVETDEGSYCARYKNPLEEAKELLNARTERRRVWFVDGMMGFAALAGGLFAFLAFGRWKRVRSGLSRVSTVAAGALLGFVWAGLLAAALTVVAPAPESWFPRFITQQHEAAVAHRLDLARTLARQIGAR